MVWLLMVCGEILVLSSGQQIECDRYARADELVVLTREEMRYTIRAETVDWARTLASTEHPPPSRKVERSEPEEDESSADDFMVAELEVRRASLIDLIRFLADMRDINLYIDPSVEDRLVTYRFRDLPWLAIMEIVCRDAGAAISLNGRLLHIGD